MCGAGYAAADTEALQYRALKIVARKQAVQLPIGVAHVGAVLVLDGAVVTRRDNLPAGHNRKGEVEVEALLRRGADRREVTGAARIDADVDRDVGEIDLEDRNCRRQAAIEERSLDADLAAFARLGGKEHAVDVARTRRGEGG